MKFFIPAADNAEQTTRVYAAIRTFVAGNMGPLSPRRVYRLSYKHNGKLLTAEVGKPDPLVGELIVAIFASDRHDLYYLCTENRGVVRGDPILAGASNAVSEDFDIKGTL